MTSTATATPRAPTQTAAPDPSAGALAFLQQVLRAAEGDPGLRLHEVRVKPGSAVGDNYMSVLTREVASGVRGDGTSYRRSVMVKRYLLSEHRREMFRCAVAFQREADAYSELLPALRAGARRAAVGTPFAQCLHAGRTGHDTDVIVLEDLATDGFTMADRRLGLDVHHALLVMEALGRFHGMSMALRRTDPEAFRRMRERITEFLYCAEGEPFFGPALKYSMAMAERSLRTAGRPDLADRLGARLDGAFREMCDVVRASEDPDEEVEPVITHGDCWINNMLFKYAEDGAVEDIRLVDLQVIRVSSPVLDVLHVLYSSLQDGVREAHRDALVQRYHTALTNTVRDIVEAAPDNGVPVEVRSKEVASLDAFKAELDKRAAYGLWHGLFMLPAVVVDSSTIPDMDNGDVDTAFSEDWSSIMPAAYHERVLAMVEEQVLAGHM